MTEKWQNAVSPCSQGGNHQQLVAQLMKEQNNPQGTGALCRDCGMWVYFIPGGRIILEEPRESVRVSKNSK